MRPDTTCPATTTSRCTATSQAAFDRLSDGADLDRSSPAHVRRRGSGSETQVPDVPRRRRRRSRPSDRTADRPAVRAAHLRAARSTRLAIYAPRIYAPRIYAPRIYAPRIYAPDSYIPDARRRHRRSSDAFSAAQNQTLLGRLDQHRRRRPRRVSALDRQHRRLLLRPGAGPRRHRRSTPTGRSSSTAHATTGDDRAARACETFADRRRRSAPHAADARRR